MPLYLNLTNFNPLYPNFISHHLHNHTQHHQCFQNLNNTILSYHKISIFPFLINAGTPRALEKFREKLIAGHGILAMSVLRFYMGSGNIVRSQLQESFTLMEVDMDRSEFNQVFVFIF